MIIKVYKKSNFYSEFFLQIIHLICDSLSKLYIIKILAKLIKFAVPLIYQNIKISKDPKN